MTETLGSRAQRNEVFRANGQVFALFNKRTQHLADADVHRLSTKQGFRAEVVEITTRSWGKIRKILSCVFVCELHTVITKC